jgi:AraC-like DNA-binding protein
MSQKRQTIHACPAAPSHLLVTTVTYDFADAQTVPEHYHQEDQLVYASRGVMTVKTDEGIWIVPAHRAVWIPAKVPHSVIMSGPVAMRTLYLKRRLVRHLPTMCRVINVSPLLRELILHTCRLERLKSRVKSHRHLVELMIEQLEAGEAMPLQLPNPSDSRAKRVAEALQRDPSDRRPLGQICRTAGASKRTIERIFQSETKMRLGEWRRQLRLIRSLQLLAANEKITQVALESGYNTASAFIAMFKKALGTTPAQYFEAGKA